MKLYTLFKTQDPEDHTLLSGTYPFRQNKEVPPPRGGALDSDQKIGGLRPSPCNRVASLDKKLVSLHPGV